MKALPEELHAKLIDVLEYFVNAKVSITQAPTGELINALQALPDVGGEARYFEQRQGCPIEEIDADRFNSIPADSRFKLYATPQSAQICPVAIVLEQLEDNQARIQWMFNPVPEGQELQWDHGPAQSAQIPAYATRLIAALQENSDPVSIDAAEELQRLYGMATPQSAQIPAGWKLVPIEPTDEMVAIGQSIFGSFVEDTPADYKRIYAAMLSAAPQPPQADVARDALVQPFLTDLAKDAARYRWLRDASNLHRDHREVYTALVEGFTAKEIEDAIDAAMQGEQL